MSNEDNKKPRTHYYDISGDVVRFAGAIIHFIGVTLSSFEKIGEIRKRYPKNEVRLISVKKLKGGGK